jgi:hypothetical protein
MKSFQALTRQLSLRPQLGGCVRNTVLVGKPSLCDCSVFGLSVLGLSVLSLSVSVYTPFAEILRFQCTFLMVSEHFLS